MSSNFLNDNLFSVYANSNKIFIETESQKYSFKEFDDLVNKIANLLIASDLSEGDRVLVKLEKSIFSFALYIASIRAGGIFVPVNNDYTASEIDYFIENSIPYIFISNDESIKKVQNRNIFDLGTDEIASLSGVEIPAEQSDEYEAIMLQSCEDDRGLFDDIITGPFGQESQNKAQDFEFLSLQKTLRLF